ncbi:MAG TPA: DUF308 domain-containing protein [Gemmatimonadaceae bacterium]|jgi:uncharacterized membrane protein HdeD (DUF308 family)|nr:DUF308 domain-containing protein [Gemmatimonadaceae bacterium]
MDGIQARLSDSLQHRWTALLWRGIIAIAIGLLVWSRPGISLKLLILAFGLWALVDGLVNCWLAFEDRPEKSWGWMLLDGIIGIVIGLIALARPGATALGLLFLIATWAVLRGILEIVVAISLRKELAGEWRLLLAGALSIVFGAIVFARPGAGLLAVIWIIGFYAVLYGIMLVMLAFKAKNLGKGLAAGV